MAKLNNIWVGKTFYKGDKEDIKITVQAQVRQSEQQDGETIYKDMLALINDMYVAGSRF